MSFFFEMSNNSFLHTFQYPDLFMRASTDRGFRSARCEPFLIKFDYFGPFGPSKNKICDQNAWKPTPKTPRSAAMPLLAILVNGKAYVRNLAVLREW